MTGTIADPQVPAPGSANPEQSRKRAASDDSASDGMEQVSSRQIARKRKKLMKLAEPPSLTIHDQSRVYKMKDIRDLVLWTIGEGVNTPWVLIRQKHHIRRVVMAVATGLNLRDPQQQEALPVLRQLFGAPADFQAAGSTARPFACLDETASVECDQNPECAGAGTASGEGDKAAEAGASAAADDAQHQKRGWWVRTCAPGEKTRIYHSVSALLQCELTSEDKKARRAWALEQQAKQPGAGPALADDASPTTAASTDAAPASAAARDQVLNMMVLSKEILRANNYFLLDDISSADVVDAESPAAHRPPVGFGPGAPAPTSPLPAASLKPVPFVASAAAVADAGTEFDGPLTVREEDLIAIDCEMCMTEAGQELTRLSAVNHKLEVLVDILVKPYRPIIDYNTKFSGITEEILAPVTARLADARAALLKVMSPTTVLVGHSLENDLSALRLLHSRVIDTSVVYHHTRGPPFKAALRWLAERHLKMTIQTGTRSPDLPAPTAIPGGLAADGHDSVEDACATMKLVLLKAQRGFQYGLAKEETESLFRRLARVRCTQGVPLHLQAASPGGGRAPGRQSSVIDTPNSMPSHAIDGVTSPVPASGDDAVAAAAGRQAADHDFLFLRFSELERLQNSRIQRTGDETDAAQSDAGLGPTEADLAEDRAVIARLNRNIARVWNDLPPGTLFLFLTGQGDMTQVKRLLNRINGRKRLQQAMRNTPLTPAAFDAMTRDDLELQTLIDAARVGWCGLAVRDIGECTLLGIDGTGAAGAAKTPAAAGDVSAGTEPAAPATE
ncbi:hypothetical protein H696_04291 [Fonticula alba]|uniref:Exonuclease domain-containing protein n=1 Tax=Fonticula alba TaxID=691883 RepID=A0A058Z5S7_FONAL|nr:hypothetical protein H696_04291 [Fonticula alba]KCV68872.1 hypothetical protein H696_04291 [Fonticula alba]|eukprot:XP_009496443.1 hypothetical protein H696_04291 [Fonticula alba]